MERGQRHWFSVCAATQDAGTLTEMGSLGGRRVPEGGGEPSAQEILNQLCCHAYTWEIPKKDKSYRYEFDHH